MEKIISHNDVNVKTDKNDRKRGSSRPPKQERERKEHGEKTPGNTEGGYDWRQHVKPKEHTPQGDLRDACRKNEAEAVRNVIQANNAVGNQEFLNDAGKKGMTNLMYCAKRGNTEAAKELLDAKANINTADNK